MALSWGNVMKSCHRLCHVLRYYPEQLAHSCTVSGVDKYKICSRIVATKGHLSCWQFFCGIKHQTTELLSFSWWTVPA